MPDYFTLEELRALPNVSDAARFSDARVEEAAAYLVGVIEREVGTSFVTRTRGPVVLDGGAAYLDLDPMARDLVLVLIDGVNATSACRVRGGTLRRRDGIPFAPGTENIEVTYLSGYSTEPPSDVKEMALLGTRAHLIATADGTLTTSRETGLQNDFGNITYAIAGKDRPTGYPEVDAMIVAWREKLQVFGFA